MQIEVTHRHSSFQQCRSTTVDQLSTPRGPCHHNSTPYNYKHNSLCLPSTYAVSSVRGAEHNNKLLRPWEQSPVKSFSRTTCSSTFYPSSQRLGVDCSTQHPITLPSGWTNSLRMPLINHVNYRFPITPPLTPPLPESNMSIVNNTVPNILGQHKYLMCKIQSSELDNKVRENMMDEYVGDVSRCDMNRDLQIRNARSAAEIKAIHTEFDTERQQIFNSTLANLQMQLTIPLAHETPSSTDDTFPPFVQMYPYSALSFPKQPSRDNTVPSPSISADNLLRLPSGRTLCSTAPSMIVTSPPATVKRGMPTQAVTVTPSMGNLHQNICHINADNFSDCSRKMTSPLRGNRLLNRQAVRLMERWYTMNIHHPYPSEETVKSLSSNGNITVAQVKKWMANKRVRTCNTMSHNYFTQLERFKRGKPAEVSSRVPVDSPTLLTSSGLCNFPAITSSTVLIKPPRSISTCITSRPELSITSRHQSLPPMIGIQQGNCASQVTYTGKRPGQDMYKMSHSAQDVNTSSRTIHEVSNTRAVDMNKTSRAAQEILDRWLGSTSYPLELSSSEFNKLCVESGFEPAQVSSWLTKQGKQVKVLPQLTPANIFRDIRHSE